MKEISLGSLEENFAHIIWDAKEITSAELIRVCEKEFNWKRTTTYTVLKRLCNKGLFKCEGGVVSVVMTEEEYKAIQSQHFIRTSFGDSLPAFFCAFTKGRKLSKEEVNYLTNLVDEYKEKK